MLNLTEIANTQLFGNLLTLILALTPAIFATVLYRIKRSITKQQVIAIGEHFRTIVEQITSGTVEKKVSSAILLRRFFDPKSEFGIGGTPYAKDCLTVTCALLKVLPTSNLQKVLADNLRYAPTDALQHADFQRANLAKAYLGRRPPKKSKRTTFQSFNVFKINKHLSTNEEFSEGEPLNLSEADFFQADLSGASLRGAILFKAKFYEATLSNTTLRDTDLRSANFHAATLHSADLRGADLTGASFSGATLINVNFQGAKLEGANFDGARGTGNKFNENKPLNLNPFIEITSSTKKIFLSKPGILDARQQHLVASARNLIESRGFEAVELRRGDYDACNVVSKLNKMIVECSAVIVFGFRSLYVSQGEHRLGTDDYCEVKSLSLSTPWNQIEAGMAVSLGKMVMLVHDNEVSDGIFDPSVQDSYLQRITFAESLSYHENGIVSWLDSLEN